MKKILIIEDDLDIQELIQFFLEDQGYEVITASDGIDGIAVFLKEQIDLILLDILLPKMDGYAVCELIRKESEVPIIMISALGREEDQIKGFEMQIDDYIPKPISLPIMIKKIEAVLRRYEGVDITKDHELKYREIILIGQMMKRMFLSMLFPMNTMVLKFMLMELLAVVLTVEIWVKLLTFKLS